MFSLEVSAAYADLGAIATFKGQLQKLGLSYDWSREVNTSDPSYYKWTQWIFLQLYNSYYNSEKQKAENKILSSKRIFVEHLIRIIKIFQIASQRFRLDSDVYNEIILTVCGLVRLRIGALVL